MHRRFGALLVIVLLPMYVQAQDQRAYFTLSINGVEHEDALVLLRTDDVLVSVAALESAGLRGFAGRRERGADAEFVSLSSLAPSLTFRIDDDAFTLILVADPALLGVVVRDLATGAPPDIVYGRAPSAFLNYSLTAGTGAGPELFTEAGTSVGGALFYTTMTRNAQHAVRGLSNLTIDNRSRLQRWVVGDAFVSGGPLGGDALLAGLTVSREFSIAPYFVRHPTISLGTPVSTPSVLEVHVNGRLIREDQVQPGHLDVRHLPVTAGQNETRLVLRDAFGGTREITSGFYLTSAALARGVHEYQYSLGWQRQGLTTDSWKYLAPLALARHRLGVTDAVTVGFRVEARHGLVSGGPSLNVRLPAGEVEVAAGTSRRSGVRGSAGQASYAYQGRRVSLGGLATYMADDYANASLRIGQPRAAQALSGFGSAQLGRSSLTMQHGIGRGADGTREQRTSVVTSARLTRAAELVGNIVSTRRAGGSDLEMSVGVSVMFGPRTMANVSAQRGRTGTGLTADLQRPLPVGAGYGYQIRTQAGAHTAVLAAAQYQTQYGRYDVRSDGLGGSSRTTVNLSGGLVAIGGGLHATRLVRDSFALVRVPDVEGVRTFSSNQEVGRTGSRGTFLVSDLLPYYGNRLAIADSDVPLDYQLSDVQMTLAPPYRGGAVALFPARRVQRITGRIVILTPAGERQPSYGTLTVGVTGEAATSPLGARGEFYLESVASGRHDAVVSHGDRACRLSLEIPVSDSAVVVLGVLTCSEEPA